MLEVSDLFSGARSWARHFDFPKNACFWRDMECLLLFSTRTGRAVNGSENKTRIAGDTAENELSQVY